MNDALGIERSAPVLFRELDRSRGLLRYASIRPHQVRVIASDTEHTRIIEVDGKRYRARRWLDDGVECFGWGPMDEIRDGGQ